MKRSIGIYILKISTYLRSLSKLWKKNCITQVFYEITQRVSGQGQFNRAYILGLSNARPTVDMANPCVLADIVAMFMTLSSVISLMKTRFLCTCILNAYYKSTTYIQCNVWYYIVGVFVHSTVLYENIVFTVTTVT